MTTLTPPDPRKAMRQNLTFLHEYAKRVIVEGAVHPDFLHQRVLNIVRGVRLLSPSTTTRLAYARRKGSFWRIAFLGPGGVSVVIIAPSIRV